MNNENQGPQKPTKTEIRELETQRTFITKTKTECHCQKNMLSNLVRIKEIITTIQWKCSILYSFQREQFIIPNQQEEDELKAS